MNLKGGSDSLGLDSFTNELKEGIDWHEEEPFKLSFGCSDCQTSRDCQRKSGEWTAYRCDAIDKEHLTVVEASNFLDISKENVEEKSDRQFVYSRRRRGR